jgi:tetratricopeptide (TPR) repeat protein
MSYDDYDRRQDYMREDSTREYNRELDRKWENQREDIKYETEKRARETEEGMRAARQGDTAWAISKIAGPDLAIQYLQATQAPSSYKPRPSSSDYVARAQEQADQGDYARAIETLNQALALNSNLSIAYLERGSCRLQMKD